MNSLACSRWHVGEAVDEHAVVSHCVKFKNNRTAERSPLIEGGTGRDLRHFFSDCTIPFDATDLKKICKVVHSFWKLFELPKYLREVEVVTDHLFGSSSLASAGIFSSFDFHLTDGGPRLIEINTNAGGAVLCDYVSNYDQADGCRATPSAYVLDVFEEWGRQVDGKRLASLAIIDDKPEEQYLFSEMLLFAQQLRAVDIAVYVCSPDELMVNRSGVWFDEQRIDFIYNRNTDFAATDGRMRKIWSSAADGQVVVSPNPDNYFRIADKRLLKLFGNLTKLKSLGLSPSDCYVISEAVPKTELLMVANADEHWEGRKNSFFKPQNGFGSKAVYDGSRISRRKFNEILSEGYVVQTKIEPPRFFDANTDREFKYDVRAYTYGGRVNAIVPRLYRGQVTNFRTAGGGFGSLSLSGDCSVDYGIH